jgi:hypothetical protein
MLHSRAYWAGLARKQYSGLRGAIALYLAATAIVSALVATAIALAG